MLSLRKTFSQLPRVVQACPHQQKPGNLLAAIGGTSNVLNSTRCLDTLYGAESCEDCVKSYLLPRARPNLKKMKKPDPTKNKDPCWQSLRRTEYKCRTDPEFMLDSFIDEKKKCLQDPCAWDVPRADLTHYRPSDKLRRKYQRTWIKCVVKRKSIKMKCAWKPVQLKRRKFKRVTFRSQCDSKERNPCAPQLELISPCKPLIKTDCPRVSMPFCKPSVVPPKCKKGGRPPKKCRKRLTKYPAFSECLIDPLPTAPPVECNCLKTPSMCSVWEYFRNKKS